MTLAILPVDQIETGQRLRQLSEVQVETLVASIADIGLLNPITVYARQVIRSGEPVDGFGLVAGAHRLEAFRRLGMVEIEANIVSLSELERQIAECDENLCGSVLSKVERAMFTKRRKDAYEALHPQTKQGAFNQHTVASRQVGDKQEVDRFTADTAAKTGQSERAVQRDAERGMKISDRALETLRGTKLDNGSYLDKLKAIPANDQVTHVKADLAALKKPPVPVKHAPDPRNDFEVKESQVAALMLAWNKAGKEAREEFLARIDTPVMDRSAA